METNKELNLLRKILILPAFIVVFFFVVITFLIVKQNKYTVEEEMEHIKHDYISLYKNFTKREVDKIYDFIDSVQYNKPPFLKKLSEEKLKKRVIERIKAMRYDENGYIFIFDYTGNFLTAQNKTLVGEKKTELRKKILEKGNGFISYPTLHSQKGYKTLKISYIRSFEKWKWIIGYGFHPDDIKPVLNKRIAKLQRDQQAFIEKVTFVYFLFAFIISSTILVFSSKIKTILNSYRATIEENERKKKEQDEIIYHQSKMATIGELLNIISHQWRQPLSQINSLTLDTYLEQRHGTLNEDILKKNISDIEGITEYLSQTIDDFGNYFIQDKNKKPFLVEDAVKGCIKLLSPSLKSINLNVQIKSEKEINGFITLFQQVILTMITNSLDAFNINNTEKPKITIASYDKEEFTYITISDNAGGIKGENIKKVFDLYYSTKLKNTPSGLGLYIAKKIIENTMQGKVTVTNTSQGAEFTIKVINSGT